MRVVAVLVIVISAVSCTAVSESERTRATQPAVSVGVVHVPTGGIYYESAGQGQTVVLVHDGVLDRQTWNDQFPALADTYRVVRYDRRGYGRSTAPTSSYSNIDDLLALFAALRIDHATLVGCSAGGGLSIDFTIAHPTLVQSLVLIGAVVDGLPFSDHYRTRGGHVPSIEQRNDAARMIDYWSSIDPYYVSPTNLAVRARIRGLMTASPRGVTGTDRFAQRPSWSTLKRLPEVHAPTLILVGEDDIADVHAHAGAIQAGIGGATRIVVPKAGHLVHMEQPAFFNIAVRDFLKVSGAKARNE
jgi:3-oxoadipate enol-lactonase